VNGALPGDFVAHASTASSNEDDLSGQVRDALGSEISREKVVYDPLHRLQTGRGRKDDPDARFGDVVAPAIRVRAGQLPAVPVRGPLPSATISTSHARKGTRHIPSQKSGIKTRAVQELTICKLSRQESLN
jgi:hypothetical protein